MNDDDIKAKVMADKIANEDEIDEDAEVADVDELAKKAGLKGDDNPNGPTEIDSTEDLNPQD